MNKLLLLIFAIIIFLIIFSPISEKFTASAGGVFQQLASTSTENPYYNCNRKN